MDEVVEEFLEEPCESDLKLCTKRHLIAIAEFYKVFIGNSTVLRSVLEDNLKKQLFGMGILVSPVGLTFEQQKELLLVQVEAEKERAMMRLEVEMVKHDIEQQKLILERQEMQSSPIREHAEDELVPEARGQRFCCGRQACITGSQVGADVPPPVQMAEAPVVCSKPDETEMFPEPVLPCSVAHNVLVVEQKSGALEGLVRDTVHLVVGSLKCCDAVLQFCHDQSSHRGVRITCGQSWSISSIPFSHSSLEMLGSEVWVTCPIESAGFDAESQRLWHPGERKVLERRVQYVVVLLFPLKLAGLHNVCWGQARMIRLETMGTGLEAGARSVLVEAWMLQPTVQATLGWHGGDPKSRGLLYFGGTLLDATFTEFLPTV
ncbi:unnamed protein product [Knipowitschia caucasica]